MLPHSCHFLEVPFSVFLNNNTSSLKNNTISCFSVLFLSYQSQEHCNFLKVRSKRKKCHRHFQKCNDANSASCPTTQLPMTHSQPQCLLMLVVYIFLAYCCPQIDCFIFFIHLQMPFKNIFGQQCTTHKQHCHQLPTTDSFQTWMQMVAQQWCCLVDCPSSHLFLILTFNAASRLIFIFFKALNQHCSLSQNVGVACGWWLSLWVPPINCFFNPFAIFVNHMFTDSLLQCTNKTNYFLEQLLECLSAFSSHFYSKGRWHHNCHPCAAAIDTCHGYKGR